MSIQQGSNIILEAIVKDPNNNLLEGVPVEFYDGNTSKGESITDEYGNAKSEMFEVDDPSDLEAWACQVVNDGYVYAHDYDVSFTQDTFIGEVGSSISVSVLVTDMNEPVNGAGVILKSNIGTTYTSNTNSSGIATFSISDLSEIGTYTFEASYGSLTATCNVLIPIYWDKVTSDNSSNYYVNTTKNSFTYNSNGYYVLSSINTGQDMYVDLRGYKDVINGKKVRFEADCELNGNTISIAITASGIKTQNYTQDGVIYIEGTVSSSSTTSYLRILKSNATSGDSIKIKSFLVYFIDE